MLGPDEEFRAYVWERAQFIESEEELDELLSEVEQRVEGSLNLGLAQTTAEEDLAAAESWASVASYPMARLSAPASPWPRNVAGWGTRAVGRLRRIANTLSAALQGIAPALGAQSFSIGVSFPWGIQISLSW